MNLMSSAKALYDFFDGKGELLPAFLGDLFGYRNWNESMKDRNNRDETLTMFLGLYKGLYLMEISHKVIHMCFVKNKLDDLIHTSYSIKSNGYYREFCDKNIRIGGTFFGEYSECMEPIPHIYAKIQPPYHFYQSKTPELIAEESIGDIDAIISHKIDGYKRQDTLRGRSITEDYVTVEDVKHLLLKQDNKCYVCCDTVITQEWQQNCLYHFTLDRINNAMPHNRNNVLICCFYCNCYSHIDDGTDLCLYKLCSKKCHQIKRHITRTRNDVPKEEIEKMLLL
jgi:hypothetical protein